MVLGPIVLVFVAWGAYGIVNLSVGSSNYAAEADGTKISLEEARNAWLRSAGHVAAAPGRRGAARAACASSCRTRCSRVSSGAHSWHSAPQKLGYRVSSAELRDAIQGEPAFQIAASIPRRPPRPRWRRRGISLETFENELRTDVRRVQLEGGIRGFEFPHAESS